MMKDECYTSSRGETVITVGELERRDREAQKDLSKAMKEAAEDPKNPNGPAFESMAESLGVVSDIARSAEESGRKSSMWGRISIGAAVVSAVAAVSSLAS